MTEKEFLEIKKFIESEFKLMCENTIVFSCHDTIANGILLAERLSKFIKFAPTFKKGDKIAYYQSNKRYIGIVKKIKDTKLYIEDITNEYCNWFHKKQCRKLKKKP